jgi:hypothetical protein
MSNNCISQVADNLVKKPENKNNNYWSPLSCLVKEQEDNEVEHTSANHLLSAVTDFQPSELQNKIATKWKRKLKNRSGILDTGCILGAGAKHDADYFHDAGLSSKKVFMLPDKTKIKATNKMHCKHNLRPKASKMNIVLNLHSMLISVPKVADADYIAVFNKKEARIYNATTTIVSATKDPILVAPCCQDTGLWKLDLDYDVLSQEYPDQFIAGAGKANAIFDLPNTHQSLLYHHGAARFSPKDTFLDTVRAGNYTTWPGLTTTLILKHFPNLDKTQKGHMKGQLKGVQSTKVTALVTIKVEPGTANPPPPTIKKHYDIFVAVYKLLDTIHMDQTGTFTITLQQGYWYIMAGIHLDANYIFCKLMKNRTNGKMITAYQRMVDRMKLLALRLKHHHLDNECSAKFKECIAKNGMNHKLVPPNCHHRNIAKRAIQRFKNNFVSILSGINNRFPLSLWCHLVHPEELAGNLLQQINIAPKVSMYAHAHCPWETLLHEMPICTSGMRGDGPRQTEEPTNLGHPRRHRLQHLDGNGASLMFPHLHCENKSNKN